MCIFNVNLLECVFVYIDLQMIHLIVYSLWFSFVIMFYLTVLNIVHAVIAVFSSFSRLISLYLHLFVEIKALQGLCYMFYIFDSK